MKRTETSYGTQLLIRANKGIKTSIGFCHPIAETRELTRVLKYLEECSTVVMVPYLCPKMDLKEELEAIEKTKKALELQSSKVIVFDDLFGMDPNKADYPGRTDNVCVTDLSRDTKYNLARGIKAINFDKTVINIGIAGQNITTIYDLCVGLNAIDVLSNYDIIVGPSLGSSSKLIQVEDYSIIPFGYEKGRVKVSMGPKVTETEAEDFESGVLPITSKGYSLLKVAKLPCRIDIAQGRGRQVKRNSEDV